MDNYKNTSIYESKLEEISLAECQQVSIDILRKIVSISNELGIKCHGMFGTVLGTVRHNGFIPWDDDIDVGFVEDDYDRFISYCIENEEKLYPLKIHNKFVNDKCFFNISRLCDERYLVRFDNRDYTSGIFVDLYKIEGLGNDKDLPYWKKHFKTNRMLIRANTISNSNIWFFGHNALYKVLNLPFSIYVHLRGHLYFLNKMDKYKRFAIDSSKYAGNPSWENCIFLSKHFSDCEACSFEGIEIFIPKDYDSYLRIKYGSDYMTPPPPDERVPHHEYTAYKIVC